jgi:hypothetical protein
MWESLHIAIEEFCITVKCSGENLHIYHQDTTESGTKRFYRLESQTSILDGNSEKDVSTVPARIKYLCGRTPWEESEQQFISLHRNSHFSSRYFPFFEPEISEKRRTRERRYP